jgi:hypothetical protein
LREQAIALRRQGKSRRQIKEILGPMSNATLNEALEGEPPPEWTRRPRAKDDLRASARELRGRGMDLEEIAAALGVSKSHENADVAAAEHFWLEVTEATIDQFATPTLKRHNPKTVRKNVGETYHGCLRIDVRHSADLYRTIEGWAAASMADDRRVNPVPATSAR